MKIYEKHNSGDITLLGFRFNVKEVVYRAAQMLLTAGQIVSAGLVTWILLDLGGLVCP